MLSPEYGQIRPGDVDDFTPREWEALMRDYQQRGGTDG